MFQSHFKHVKMLILKFSLISIGLFTFRKCQIDKTDALTVCRESCISEDYSSDKDFIFINESQRCRQKCRPSSFGLDFNSLDTLLWIWSIVCFLSTLTVLVAFILKPSMFKHPSRPFIFLAMCLNVTSVGYIIRAYSGCGSVVCEKSSSDITNFIPDGTSKRGCVAIFIL